MNINAIQTLQWKFFTAKQGTKKTLTINCEGFQKKAVTYSSTSVVPSALMGLTTLFGMVRGEPHCNNHLRVISCLVIRTIQGISAKAEQ